MIILLLGKTGQVGFELHRTLAPLGAIIAPGREELNLMDASALEAFLADTRPNLIVNAAAWTAVDLAEKHQAEAWRLNAGLPAQLAAYAKANDVRVVHYSSDYVYPGNGDAPWHEVSRACPVNYYGKTKLEGDRSIEQSGADFLIFRTSWVYSARGSNFMKTMLRLAKSEAEIRIVADEIGAPTPARLIAQVTTLAIHNQLNKGLYHLAPRGHVSWHGFASEIFRLTLQFGQPLTLEPENVFAIPSSDYPTPAQRPLNSRIDVSKLEKALSVRLPAWQNELAVTLAEYLEK